MNDDDEEIEMFLAQNPPSKSWYLHTGTDFVSVTANVAENFKAIGVKAVKLDEASFNNLKKAADG